MRKLAWFALGFGAACGLCAYLLPKSVLLPLLMVGILMSASLGIAGRKYTFLRCTAWVLLGLSLGFGWYLGFYRVYLNQTVAIDGQESIISVRTTDYSDKTAYGTCVDGIIALEEKAYQVRTYLNESEVLEPGTVLKGEFRFRVTTPDGEQDSTHHPGKGIFLLAYQKGDLVISENTDKTFREWTSQLRRTVEAILETSFPEDVAPFAKALLLGNSTGLSYETDTALKISGIRHVVAVSGLHVSILFALLTTVTLKKRYLTALLGFPMLFLFAAVAGFTPSVVRACIMSGLMLMALLADREYDRITALSFASLVMLMSNPMVITSVSFQLSVASVAGICLFDVPIRKWMLSLLPLPSEKSKRKTVIIWLESSVSVTLSAMVLTVPLCAVHFGTVSLISVVTNLLTLWVISFVFYGLMAVCILHLFWESGAVLLAGLVAWPIRYVQGVSGLLSRFPLAAVYTRSSYILAWLIFVYMLLILFLLSKDRKPVTLVCCSCIGLCLSLLLSWMEPMKDQMRMTVLDVGQGQCILLQSQGKTYMVDCGGDSNSRAADIAAETLLSQGITRLDGLILTHYDDDHAGAAANLLTRIPADILILPPEFTAKPLDAENTVYADRDLRLDWNETTLTVFAAEYPGTGNEKSLCILFDTPKCDILITGDRTDFGERMLLRYHSVPDVDVLIAGHHGAESSTCEELLEAVRPETVCISAAEGNIYGHPHEKLLERLDIFGCAVYRTDQNGTIIIRR